jgi:hypothetical protein
MTGHGAFRSTYWLTSPSSRAGECSFLVASTTTAASNSRAVCTRTHPGGPATARIRTLPTSLSRASATATRSADTADSTCSAGQPDSGERLRQPVYSNYYGHSGPLPVNDEICLAAGRAQIKDEKTYRELRDKGASKEKSARIANAAAASSRSAVGRKGGRSPSYDDWSKAGPGEKGQGDRNQGPFHDEQG